MKILLLTNHLNTGGITSYLLSLAKGYRALGHDVFLLSNSGNCLQRFKDMGVHHFECGFRLKSDADIRIYFALPFIKELRRLNLDIVHSQTRVTQVLAQRYSRVLRVAHVSTCHGFFKPRLSRMLWPCWGRKVIAISRPVYQHLKNDFQVNPSNIVLIPNGIDLSDFVVVNQTRREQARQWLGIQSAPVIGIVARLSDVKGHVYLIQAFKKVLERFSTARLVIVGEGPQEDELRRWVAELKMESQVKFIKIVNQTSAVLPAFDVFVMPSVQEGLGLSVLEAQAVGLAVVASNVGGLPEIVEPGHTGWLVEPQNPYALAEVLVEVLSNPARSWDVGRAARMFVEKNFSSSSMVRSTLDLYESLREL